MTEHQDEVREQEQIRVIVCRPMEKAEVIEIGDDLRSMQETVGGMIEEYMPFYDENDPRVEDIAIICDDEGLLKDSLPSAVTAKDEVQLVGNLLLVNHDEEGNFTSLTDEQIEDLGKHLVMAMMAYKGDTRVYGLLKDVEYV